MKLQQTRQWCSKAHGMQLYGPFPYSYHLRAVENVALRFGFRSPRLRKAIWLHDVIEDCKLSVSHLVLAGHDAQSVKMAWAVSDSKGKTRKQRKAKTYAKINATPGAKLVKLCDRIANVEFSSSGLGNPAKFEMYRQEYAEFKRKLYNAAEVELEPLWRHLDTLLA